MPPGPWRATAGGLAGNRETWNVRASEKSNGQPNWSTDCPTRSHVHAKMLVSRVIVITGRGGGSGGVVGSMGSKP